MKTLKNALRNVFFGGGCLCAIIILVHSDLSPIWYWDWYRESLNALTKTYPNGSSRILGVVFLWFLFAGACSHDPSLDRA